MAPRKTKSTTIAKKNPWRSSHVSLPSWILFWALVMCTMALIVVNFSKAFTPITNETVDDQTAAQFQAIRASLEQQVANLQAQVPSSTAPTVPTCEVPNPGPADSHVLYIDPKTHVRMSLPYSTSWGNGCAPLTVNENGTVSFGPDGQYTEIEISSTTTVDQKKKELSGAGISFHQSVINGLTVFTYSGPNTGYVWEAVGRTFNYMIASHGWLTDVEAVKLIQSLKVVK